MVSAGEAIERIRGAFGVQDGSGRTLHAKGRFYAGTFTASRDAARRCRAGHLQGDPVPVRVRWSNGAGRVDGDDRAPDVRGMAVSFRLPDGTATDLLGQTAPRFPVRTPDAFVRMVEASRRPRALPGFLLRNPSAVPALAANARYGALVPPRSFAEATYFPIHAYRWIAPDGSTAWVRYTLEPDGSELGRATGEFGGRDRLFDEIEARLAQGPVRFVLRVAVAGAGDDPHDPMSVWRDTGAFTAGSFAITAPDPERETGGEVVVFDPTRVVDGIELSDDPILRFRPAAYSESVSRRA